MFVLFCFVLYCVTANTRVQATWPITVPGCAQPAIHRTRCVALRGAPVCGYSQFSYVGLLPAEMRNLSLLNP